MAAILEVKNGPMAGKNVMAKTGQTLSVGRAEGRANFALPNDTFMSGIHFTLECSPEGCRIIDNSRNGTYLNGSKVTEAMLANGDEIRGGQTVFKVRFVADDTLPSTESAASRPPVRLKAEAPQPAQSRVGSGMLETWKEPQPSPVGMQQPRVSPAPERQPAGLPPSRKPSPSSPKLAAKQRTSAPIKAPALTVGSWTFSVVPDGWKVKEEFGVERDEQGAFPSSVVSTEEMWPGTLQQFLDVQLSMLRKYLRDPTIEAGMPPAIAGAEETVSIDVRYKTKDGQPVVYQRIYARIGTTVGTMTLTTLEPDLPKIRPDFEAILSGAAFRRNPTT